MRMRKEGLVYVAVFVFSLVLSVFLVNSQDVPTNLTIQDSPPTLLSDIPNQSWEQGTSLNNAFDLDDYFSDPNGDSLTYTYSQPSGITVSIDANNSVSFSQAPSFQGQRTMVFNATDGTFTTSSNLVYLNVGSDTEPPQWSNPFMSPVLAYQNAYVNLSAFWTDDFGLSSYTFFSDQGSGFVQSSSVNFKGFQNISISQIQISASEGETVSWYFCASDTSNNENCTSIQTFDISPFPPVNDTGVKAPGIKKIIQDILGGDKISNFSVSTDHFNINLKQGTTTTRVLTISNIGTSNLTFSIDIDSLSEFIIVSDESFSLDSGESKDLIVDFSAGQRTPLGDYFGSIIITSSSGSVRVPVAIFVNEFELDFEVNVTVLKDFKEVHPGDPVTANITITNKKDLPESPISLYYSIKDFSGNVYATANQTISPEEKVSIERSLTMPSGAELGRYLFYARASTEDFTSIDSDTFLLGSLINLGAVLRFTFIFVTIFLLSGFSISLFMGYRRERDKERLLNLYLMITELKQFVNDGETDKAVDLYIRIKSSYGEPVSRTALENKEKLREEIKKLSAKLNEEIKQAGAKTQKEVKQSVEGKTEDSGDKKEEPKEEKKEEKEPAK